MTKLSRREKETVVRFSEDPEDMLTLETFNQRHALRLIKAGAVVKVTREHGGYTYWTLEMPAKWFKWPRAPRKVSEEQRARMVDQMKKSWINRGAGEQEGGSE